MCPLYYITMLYFNFPISYLHKILAFIKCVILIIFLHYSWLLHDVGFALKPAQTNSVSCIPASTFTVWSATRWYGNNVLHCLFSHISFKKIPHTIFYDFAFIFTERLNRWYLPYFTIKRLAASVCSEWS